MVKNISIIFTVCLLLSGLFNLRAQSIPSTKSSVGWAPFNGAVFAVSDKNGFSSVSQPGTFPWHSAPLAAAPSSNSTFLTLQGTNNQEMISTTITGLTTGYNYIIKYSIIASLYYYNGGANTSVWPLNTTCKVQSGAGVVSNSVDFSPGINTNKWLTRTIAFKANSNSATFQFLVQSQNNQKGVVSIDMTNQPISFDCNIQGLSTPLNTNVMIKKCEQSTVDLNNAYSGAALPPGVLLLWFKGNTHTGIPVNNVVSEIGNYYAFLYDPQYYCWNTDISTAQVFVSKPQIVFNSHIGNITCSAGTFDLNSLLSNSPGSLPPDASIVWFNNPTHSGTKYQAPGAVGAGTYYPFIYYGSQANCYNTDNSTDKVVVNPVEPVVLGYNLDQVLCPTSKGKLPSAAASGVPAGCELRYYTHPGVYGTPFTDWQNAPIGDYYATSYDPVKQCHNTGYSETKFSVKLVPQVAILEQSVTNVCPSTQVNLGNDVHTGLPSGAIVKWFYDDARQSPVYEQVGAGVYYAFYYDPTGQCYNTDKSTSKITVTSTTCTSCVAGTAQVILSGETNFQQNCPSSTVNLTNTFSGAAPAGTSLVWFTDALHSGSVVPSPTAVTAGVYYAFFYDAVNNCYNTDLSDAKVNVIEPLPVGLSATTSSLCPPTTINLNTLFQGSQPVGSVIRWFDNATHSGVQVADASTAGLGTYYAFFYFVAENCYNTDNSTSKVVVSSNCASTVQLGVKAALQGSMAVSGATMRNDLQNYFGEFIGLLPAADPYNGGVTYPNIGNLGGVAGAIVDWVKVEIRSAANPGTILETKSLLLKTDGNIVDVTGNVPSFTPQLGNVHVVIKHRNHVAIMSNPIAFGAGNVNYNFTTSLAQASNPFGDPVQMAFKNGIWCMWAGDINIAQDFSVDGVDGTIFVPAFKQGIFDAYIRSDINLDGVVDGVDGTLFNNNFKSGFYSTIINY
jgi:hypothetical protein